MKDFFKKSSITVTLIVIATSFLFYGISSGITGRTIKNGVGCTCHDPNPSENVIVRINGPDSLKQGETASYSVTIKGGPLARGGTNIASSEGILLPISSDLKLEFNNELTHTGPKEPDDETVTFNFNYTAPNLPGAQTLYANGNSVDFNGFEDGDKWNFAPNKIINVMSPTSVKDGNLISAFKLEQNYPNPFNPSTKIKYSIPTPPRSSPLAKGRMKGFVTLKVYDILGNEVATLVNEKKPAGNYEVVFNASELASGVYFYQLRTKNFIKTKKMILLR